MRSQWEKTAKSGRERRTFVRCSHSCTLPRVLRQIKRSLLIERIEYEDARFSRGANARWVDANHCIFLSAEAADTGLVDRVRNRLHRVSHVHAADHSASARGELIATLTAASGVTVVGEDGVNQASRGRAGHASRAQRATQVHQGRCKTDRRITGVVGDFGSVDRTE